MADRSTFSTDGATRLLVVRKILIASPAFWPRMRSITSLAFCGEVRMYLASALTCILTLSGCLSGRFHGLFGRRLRRMSLENPRGRELTQFVPDHILGDIHRDEFLAVVHRHGVANELRQNSRTP